MRRCGGYAQTGPHDVLRTGRLQGRDSLEVLRVLPGLPGHLPSRRLPERHHERVGGYDPLAFFALLQRRALPLVGPAGNDDGLPPGLPVLPCRTADRHDLGNHAVQVIAGGPTESARTHRRGDRRGGGRVALRRARPGWHGRTASVRSPLDRRSGPAANPLALAGGERVARVDQAGRPDSVPGRRRSGLAPRLFGPRRARLLGARRSAHVERGSLRESRAAPRPGRQRLRRVPAGPGCEGRLRASVAACSEPATPPGRLLRARGAARLATALLAVPAALRAADRVRGEPPERAHDPRWARPRIPWRPQA